MYNTDHRKAEATLQILNPDNTPAAGKKLKIDQTSHKFLFGCGAFHARDLAKAEDEETIKKLQKRMDNWLGLFNYGTLTFYWGLYEPTEGKTEYETLSKAAALLREKNIRLKGHPLCWHTVCAPWLLQYSNEEILKKQLDRIHREVTAFKGVIDMWDVINEVVIMPVFDKYDNAITRICKDKGRIGLVREVFAAAKESNPDAVLLINDFNMTQSYEILLEGLLEAGVPIGAIGLQSHQHQGYWGLEKLEEVLDRFSHFNIPLHFTENTLVSGELMPPHIVDLNDWQVDSWPTTPEGEERQARELTEMYTRLFAHPLVEAITYWDFIDGCWLKAPSGLVREDDSLKPAYNELKRLIHGEWETHTELTADENGRISFAGYKGDYRVETDGRTAVFTLDDAVNASITPV